MAVGICTVVCLALTMFAFQTKYDFTMLNGILFVCLIILMIFGLFAMIFPGKVSPLRGLFPCCRPPQRSGADISRRAFL